MRGQVQYMPCRISHLQSCHLIMKCSFEDKRQQMMHRLGDRTSYMRIHSHALLLPVLHWPWVSVAHPQRPIVFLSISVRVWSFSVCSKNTRLKKNKKKNNRKQTKKTPKSVKTNKKTHPTNRICPLWLHTLLVSQAAIVYHLKPLVQQTKELLFSALPF